MGIIWLFVFLSCFIFFSICPAPLPVLCLCVCVYISCDVLDLWPVCPVFEVCWCEDSKGVSLGFFGSLVRALAWYTFNRWNRMAWKDFCPCNSHQSVCGFCLLNLNLSLSSLHLNAQISPIGQCCQDYLTPWLVVFLAFKIVGWDTASSPSTWWHLWRTLIRV